MPLSAPTPLSAAAARKAPPARLAAPPGPAETRLSACVDLFQLRALVIDLRERKLGRVRRFRLRRLPESSGDSSMCCKTLQVSHGLSVFDVCIVFQSASE